MFLYTNNELLKKEFKSFIYNTIKKNKMLMSKFNQGYERFLHWKTLMKENEEDMNKLGKITCVHGIEKLILLNCQYYPKNLQIQCNPC